MAHRPDQDQDAEQLRALGYSSNFNRSMSLWENFALGFTYLSPVVGVYTTIAVALSLAGPPAFWTLLLAGLGQLMVALVFGEIVSNFPVAGGVYPWSRRLWGQKWAWMNGWIYVVALVGTIAAVAYGAAPFIASVFGGVLSPGGTVIVALGTLVVATILNFSGTKVLSLAATIGLIAEMLGAVVIAAGVAVAVVGLARHLLQERGGSFTPIRLSFARYLMLALELQLAADILSTSIAPTWDRIGKLGAIAVIRTCSGIWA